MDLPPNGDNLERTRRANALFTEGASTAHVVEELGIEPLEAFRLRTQYLIAVAGADGAPGADGGGPPQSRERLQQLEEHLRETARFVAQLESHLELALRANEILQDHFNDPHDP